MPDTNVHASMTTPTNFTIIAIPDTQEYSDWNPAPFTSQMNWVKNNKDALNIVFLTAEGDITVTDVSTSTPRDTQWTRASTGYALIEAAGIPYTIPYGNHDLYNGASTYFNNYFGISRFNGRSYYGGHYPTGGNDNHYTLFSASGMDFICVALQGESTPTAAIQWADGILAKYPERRAIIATHAIISDVDASWVENGKAIYDGLKDNPNLFLMLCGHMHDRSGLDGQNRRTETYNGNTVYILQADYQTWTNGGNGYLRIMTFYPATNQIKVRTYSPYLNRYETDAYSQFNLLYNMDMNQPFTCDAGGPYTGEAGQNIHCTGSATSGTTPYSWAWVFGDGETSTNQNPEHTYTTPGTYKVTLTVTDATFTTSQDTADVNVYLHENHPPVATDDTITVTENSSNNRINVRANDNDADGDSFTITSVTPPAHGSSSSDESNVFYTPTANYYGSDHFTYTITDSSGDSETATVTITITSSGSSSSSTTDNPLVFSVVNPADGSKNIPISTSRFSLTITDPEEKSFDYTIQTRPNIGRKSSTGTSGGTKSCSVFGLVYSTTYKVWVNATDGTTWTRRIYTFTTISSPGSNPVVNNPSSGGGGGDSSPSKAEVSSIPFQNNPPNNPLKPAGETNVMCGVNYTFNSSAIDPDGDRVSLLFDWGDESVSNWSEFVDSNTTVSFSHSWSSPSNYLICVYALDNNGLNSSWSTPLTVTVSEPNDNIPPFIEIEVEDSALVNQTIVFDASNSTDPDGLIIRYNWNFGDGVTGSGTTTEHQYTEPGIYNVNLTVTDLNMADYDKENFTKIIRLIINDDAKIIAANLRPSSFSYLNITLLSICVIAIGVMVYLGRKTQHILTNKSVIQKIEKIEPSIEEQVDQILLQRFKN